MRYYTPARTVLLTGAGFTQSFGGLLGKEMWEAIFNQRNIQARPKLRKRILEQMNYEDFYSEVMTGLNYDAEEKDAVAAAVKEAYIQMHRHLCRQGEPRHSASAAGVCARVIARFEGWDRERGFLFTLNQDLFIERHFLSRSRLLKIPGMHHHQWFNGGLPGDLDASHLVRLPDAATVANLRIQFEEKGSPSFVYIKLHGSLAWTGTDGSDAMVIGDTKTEMIKREPLLQWFLELFEKTVLEPERQLVIIGYGFGDQHINEIIAKAISDSRLKLIIVAPAYALDFRHRLSPLGGFIDFEPAHKGGRIWSGVTHYLRGTVEDLYHPARVDLPEKGRAFFENLGLN